MRQIASTSLELMLSDPMLRLRLAYSWPKPRCALCGTSAQGVYEIRYTCDHDEVEDWSEYVLGCHACFMSDWGRGLKCQRELPQVRMFVRVKRSDGDHTFPITTPAKHKRSRVNLILPLTCISQAPAGMREMLQ